MTIYQEIRSQPEVIAGLLEHGLGQARQLATAIRARDIRYVYLAGRGTSEHAGIYGQYLLGALNGLPVALAAPSLFTIYRQPPQLRDALVIGVSQSGQSPDILAVIDEAQRQGALTLAITNDASSPLAQRAALHFDIAAGPELAVAATKTYTAQLTAFALLAIALANDQTRLTELNQLPAALTSALRLEASAAAAAAHFREMCHCVVLGRGFQLATALEWSLKLKEMAYVVAERYSTAEFQHGPIALIEPGFPVLAIAPCDAGSQSTIELLGRLRAAGADLLALSDDETILAAHPLNLRLPSGIPGWLAPIVAIVPAQLFCYHLALARGIDPAAPRGLRKVTRTE